MQHKREDLPAEDENGRSRLFALLVQPGLGQGALARGGAAERKALLPGLGGGLLKAVACIGIA